MNITEFVPEPSRHEAFRRNRQHLIPDKPGCYALANFSKEVMYIGLATNLRRRFNQHLDSEQKTGVTALGRAMLFFWLETDEVNKVERTWMNIHAQHEGALPLLNSNYSPTST